MINNFKLPQPSTTASKDQAIAIALHILLALAMFFTSDVKMAQAVPVQVTFSGAIELISGSGVPGINLNDPVLGALIYDSTITDENPSLEIGFYPNAITSFDVTIGSKSYSLIPSSYDSRSEIGIMDDIETFGVYEDYIRFLGSVFENGNSIFHFLQLGFRTNTITPSSWIETSSVLPTDINLNTADIATGSIRLDPFSFTHAVFFSISNATMSVIPIPPAIWLFGSGLLGLIVIARRKKA
jgi:hypothetical protein